MICDFIMKEQHPSYYAFIKEGETTLGEYWESNPRSHCHDMMGHIIEWYYNGIAGILPEAPRFSKVRISPFLPENMDHFSCRFRSKSGEIGVSVQNGQEEILVKIQIPKEVEYRVDLSGLEKRGKKIKVTEQ